MAGPSRIDELRKKFDENPRRYFAPLANEYRKMGDFEQALFICQEFLPQQPGHMSGHIVYGQALFETGRHEEARSVFETALALDPENLIALRHLGDIARARGDNETARAWYRRVLESDPRNEEIAGILTALDAEPPAPSSPAPASAPAEGGQIATESAISSAAPAVEQNQTAPSPDPIVSEPLATAPSESSFDDLAKLFTSPSSASQDPNAPLELIHEGEDILGPPAESRPAKVIEPAPTTGLETFSEPAETPSGFQAHFLEGLTSPEQQAAPPPAPPEPPPPLPSAAPAREPAPASAEANTPFVTETMAELYMQQGHREQAIEVYRKLVKLHPNDSALAAKLHALEAARPQPERAAPRTEAPESSAVAEAGPTIREFLGLIAEFRPRATNNAPADLPYISTPTSYADLPSAPSEDGAATQSSSPTGRPSTPAASELSLDHVFRHATPAAGSAKQSSLSFDQFFSQQAQQDVSASEPESSSEANAGLSDDIQQFNAWLEGLKKT